VVVIACRTVLLLQVVAKRIITLQKRRLQIISCFSIFMIRLVNLGFTLCGSNIEQVKAVAIGNPGRCVHKASQSGSKQQQRSCSQSLLLLLARATYIMVLFFTHIPFVVNHTINATPPERLQESQPWYIH